MPIYQHTGKPEFFEPPGSTLDALREITDQEIWPLCDEEWPGSIIQPEGSIDWLHWSFGIFRLKAAWSIAGVYIFTKRITDWQGRRRWQPLYVGEAQDVADRLYDHEKLPDAVGLGITHIHFHFAGHAERRMAIEKELIAYYRPPLNIQGKNG